MKGVYHLTIPGRPPVKNANYAAHRGRVHLTERTRAFRRALGTAATLAGIPYIESGLWILTVRAWSPTRNKVLSESCGVDIPRLDSDAALTVVKDALVAARVFDDDARIDEDKTSRGYDPENPRVEVTLERVDQKKRNPR